VRDLLRTRRLRERLAGIIPVSLIDRLRRDEGRGREIKVPSGKTHSYQEIGSSVCWWKAPRFCARYGATRSPTTWLSADQQTAGRHISAVETAGLVVGQGRSALINVACTAPWK